MHQQVPCSLKAYVDSGIKPLVETLNRIDGLWSFQSCEGSDDELAYVELLYGSVRVPNESDFIVMARNVYRLVSEIHRAQQQDNDELLGCNIRIAIQWCGELAHPYIRIELPHNQIGAMVKLLLRCDIYGKPLYS